SYEAFTELASVLGTARARVVAYASYLTEKAGGVTPTQINIPGAEYEQLQSELLTDEDRSAFHNATGGAYISAYGTTAPAASPPADEPRPWHGADSPLEALYQWFKSEIAAVRAHVGMAVQTVEAV